MFVSAPKVLGGYIWFHVLHLGRGVLGLIILDKLPRSHDMVEKLEIEEEYGGGLDSLIQIIKEKTASIFI